MELARLDDATGTECDGGLRSGSPTPVRSRGGSDAIGRRALGTVSEWIGHRYLDPSPLHVGRLVSIVIGLLHVVAVAWTLSRWTGPGGTVIGTLAAAISPLAVLHSQYVLADVTGVLFATVLLGLAAEPTDRRIVAMGALACAAAASKFHFGLWLLAPLLCIWLRPGGFAPRLWLSVCVIGIAACVVVALVPWFWTNPFLALKEFAGVVLVKVGSGGGAARIPMNLVAIVAGLRLDHLAGLAVRPGDLWWSEASQTIPVLVPTIVGAAALTSSAVVFDRYGLVLMPGLIVVAATGWQWGLAASPKMRAVVPAALGICTMATAVSLVRAEKDAGEVDVDVRARNWIVANVPRGSHVAVRDEVNQIPAGALATARVRGDEASMHVVYTEKWRLLGFPAGTEGFEPFRQAVLNDEMFRAYLCARELQVSRDPGYVVVSYHNDPRFGLILEMEAFETLKAGSAVPDKRIDVLVVNRPIRRGRSAGETLRTRRGVRVIYQRLVNTR